MFLMKVLHSSDLALVIADSASFFPSKILSQFCVTSRGSGCGVNDWSDFGVTRLCFLMAEGVGGDKESVFSERGRLQEDAEDEDLTASLVLT